MSTIYIITLEQLCLLPRGSLVASVKMGEDKQMVFDCQGTLQVEPVHRLLRVTELYVELRPVLPDVLVRDGRAKAVHTNTSVYRMGGHPHRFVFYSDDVLTTYESQTGEMP